MTTLSKEELYNKPFLSVKEFAFLMDYHRVTVERNIRKNEIPTVHMGKSIRIDFQKFKNQKQEDQ